MVKVRRSVFETNSSSTHSLTMCSRQEFDEWRRGERVYDIEDEELVLIDKLTKEQKEDIDEETYYTYEGYNDFVSEYDDSFEDTYFTKSGEEVIAFGYYGYN